MRAYRDPDDRPVDPDADDDGSERASRRVAGPPIRAVDPDAYRPARLADEEGIAVDPTVPDEPPSLSRLTS